MSSLYGNISHSCNVPMQSAVSAHDTTTHQRRSHVARDLQSSNDDSPSEMRLANPLTAHSRVHSDAESQADMADLSSQPQQPHLHTSASALPSSSMNDLLSQLHIRLAPLSDFLTQYLAVLQAWLSCASYGQLVVVLCQHIAEVNAID